MHRRCGQIRQVHSSRRQSQILIKTSIVTEKEAVYCVAIVYDEFLKRENICQRESRENTAQRDMQSDRQPYGYSRRTSPREIQTEEVMREGDK